VDAEHYFNEARKLDPSSPGFVEGTQGNPAEAARLYELAAQMGHPRAQCNLGFMYEFGKGGLPKDQGKALEWYFKSAQQGIPNAQYNLGMVYLARGDQVEAMKWMEAAAHQGYPPAVESLKKLRSGDSKGVIDLASRPHVAQAPKGKLKASGGWCCKPSRAADIEQAQSVPPMVNNDQQRNQSQVPQQGMPQQQDPSWNPQGAGQAPGHNQQQYNHDGYQPSLPNPATSGGYPHDSHASGWSFLQGCRGC